MPSMLASRTWQGILCARSAPASVAVPAGGSQGFAIGGKIRSMENRVQGQGARVKVKIYDILSRRSTCSGRSVHGFRPDASLLPEKRGDLFQKTSIFLCHRSSISFFGFFEFIRAVRNKSKIGDSSSR